MLHMLVEMLEKQIFPLISIGCYTLAQVIGLSGASIKDTWHFQVLQELAFVAAILSFLLAVINFHLNRKEKKRNETIHRIPKRTKAKNKE